MNTNNNFLKIPLNKLYFIDDVVNFNGLSKEDLMSLKEEYDDEELNEIIKSVVWATKNPTFDFLSLLPNLQHSNKDIHKYFCKLEVSLKSL
jgi:hypothetical protein